MNRRKVIALSCLIFIIGAVVITLLTRGGLSSFLSKFSDISPPDATFSFLTQGDHLSQGSVVVTPGEVFTPMISVHDDTDPSPTLVSWIIRVNGHAFEQSGEEADGDPVLIGQPMSLDKPGLYTIYARVTDEVGNTMTYSTMVSVLSQSNSKIPSQIQPTDDYNSQP